MSKWLTAGISIISIAALGYFNFIYSPPQELNRIQLPLERTCVINQQVCQIQLSPQHTIEFSLTPFNAKPMTPLSVVLKGENIDHASVTINGSNMAMPGFPIQLTSFGNNNYQAKTTLAICAMSEMQWQADLSITIANQPYLVPFLFTTINTG